MSTGQATNSIAEAPTGMLDMNAGRMASDTSSINPFLKEVSFEADEALANVFNDHTVFKNETLLVNEGSKQYLNIPPVTDTYNTPAAKAAFNRLFDPKKPLSPFN